MVFQWLGVARGVFCGFLLSGEQVGASSVLPSLPVADNVHNSRVWCSEEVSHTNYGLHTAEFAATGVLLLQNYSRPCPRLTADCLHSELVLLQRQLPRRPKLQRRRRSKSYARTAPSVLALWLGRRGGRRHSISQAHKISSDDAMSRTKQSYWLLSREALVDDDDIITRTIIRRVVFPH